MTELSQITELARSMLAQPGSQFAVEEAISLAVDQVYEQGVGFSPWDESLIRNQAQKAITGYGKLDDLIQDEHLEEIWINSPSDVFISRDSVTSRVDLVLDEFAVRQAVERMLRDSGRRLDKSQPFVDATLANGSRLHVVIPDITKSHWAVNIRKFPKSIITTKDLISRGALSDHLCKYLISEYQSGLNILVSGATQAGKTTLLCALLEHSSSNDRIVSIEETFEIRTSHSDWVGLQAKQANLEGFGEVSLRRLVREALRMRPTRIVIGEVRQAEALDLLIALNSGIAGLCTIHANSALDAIEKLKLLPLLAGENIPAKFVSKTVERNIDLVVHAAMDNSGQRKVTEVIRAQRSANKTRWTQVQI